jgi:hypothetical protein
MTMTVARATKMQPTMMPANSGVDNFLDWKELAPRVEDSSVPVERAEDVGAEDKDDVVATVEEEEAGEGEERGSAVDTTSTGGSEDEDVVSVDSEAVDVITGVDTIVDGVGPAKLVSIIVTVKGPVMVKSLPLGSLPPGGTSWTMPPWESFGLSANWRFFKATWVDRRCRRILAGIFEKTKVEVWN